MRRFASLCAEISLPDELDEPDLELDGPDTTALNYEDEDEDACEDINMESSETIPEIPTTSSRKSTYKFRTQKFREHHEQHGSLEATVLSVLEYMRRENIDLPLLLWALSYHVPGLVTHSVSKFERTALLASDELPELLRVWYKPPRRHGRGVRSKGASTAIENFAIERVGDLVQQEMVSVGAFMRTKPEDLTPDALLAIKFSEMAKEVNTHAPILWSLLSRCSWTPRQKKEVKLKNPQTSILYMISMASFMRSNRNNALQRLMAIYLKSCGTSAKAFDTLHAMSITMSQKWTYGAVELLSQRAHDDLQRDLETYPWFGVHDNVNFRFCVFEQCSDHHSHFDSGTAGTIFVVKDPAAKRPTVADFQARRTAGSQNPITIGEIEELEIQAAPRLASRAKDAILQLLLSTTQFDLGTYQYKDDSGLKPIPRPGQLRVTDEGNITQYMLDTVHIEEASYEGNVRVMQEWLRQLKYNTVSKQKSLASDFTVPWVGDQVTASRLRGIQTFHCDDYNSYERYDWLVRTFGWFHLVFAVEQSLHTQYYGTRAGLGLVHAFDILDRRGLQTTSIQGTFHHTYEEALQHTLEARLRDLWCVVGQVDDLAQLRSRTPEQLRDLAAEIYNKCASAAALSRLENSQEVTEAGTQKPSDTSSDSVLRQSILFVRDILEYRILREAIKCGDIQTMEDMLPHLLFRFIGGTNKNYTIEICELLQGLHKEWPDDLKDFIRKYCWLTNTAGHPNAWLPIDQAEEHNVRDVKHTYQAVGPFASWEYTGKISASIPCQRRVKDHVERDVNRGLRGKSHTSPEKETDIATLQAAYHAAQAHVALVGRRQLSVKDRFMDVVGKGADSVLSGESRAFKRWLKCRVRLHMEREEDWSEDSELDV